MAYEQIIAIDATSDLMPAVLALRHQVFVVEQAVPPTLEHDEFDALAIHLVALKGEEVIGTLRIVVSGATAKLGRMAVRAADRRGGTGTRLMARAAEIAATMGVSDIVLHAQLSARDFYERLGYREEGDVFEEADIAHVTMRKRIAAT
jgi:predicted GNAT family N-acyltransferase